MKGIPLPNRQVLQSLLLLTQLDRQTIGPEHPNHIWLTSNNGFSPQRYEIVEVKSTDKGEFITQITMTLRPVSADGLWGMPDGLFDMSAWANAESDAAEAKSPIPKPSTTPPMWAKDVGRSRRPRGHNRGGSRLQWGQR